MSKKKILKTVLYKVTAINILRYYHNTNKTISYTFINMYNTIVFSSYLNVYKINIFYVNLVKKTTNSEKGLLTFNIYLKSYIIIILCWSQINIITRVIYTS